MKDVQFPVLNFLQYRLELKKIPRSDLAFNTWLIILKHGFDNPEDFYSQPFKPELILQLFEGWDKSFHIRMNGKMIPDGLLVHEYANVINPKRQEINLYMPVMEKIESMTESQVEEWIEDNWGGDIYWENQIDYGDGGHQWHFPVPTTLDMFITDCHRHKLILQWKEI